MKIVDRIYARYDAISTQVYAVVCEDVALEFWVNYYDPTDLYGGVECHEREPDLTKCSRKKCWLLHGPCYHVGSSQLAEDKYIPLWEDYGGDQDYMFRILENQLKDMVED